MKLLQLLTALTLLSPLAAQEEAEHPRLVGDDANMAYFLLEPASVAKNDDLHLVLAMPGGNGQAREFLPWMRRVQEGLGEEYAIAVLSAPVWSEEQADSVVWVTDHWKKSAYSEAKFTTEEFLRAVLEDVKKQKRFKLASVSVFGWSSSGPAVYAAATEKKAPYDGFVILCSVFKKEQLAKLSNAKGRRFYLLQGTEDDLTRLSWAEEAEEALRKNGAEVEHEWYEGGHGFGMPDPIGTLKRAFESVRQ